MRVPQADWACMKLPGRPGDDKEDDYVLLADIFPTAYHAAGMAMVSSGKTVGIFGAGPVGLLTAYVAILKGASEVYVVDGSEKRLALARSIGAIPVNYHDGDPVKQIMEMRQQTAVVKNSLHPEEKVMGVECGIDAVGYQAYDWQSPKEYNPTQVLEDLTRLINPAGHLGIIGVYVKDDPRARNEMEKKGILSIPFGEMWSKGITIGTGQAPAKNYQAHLRDLIINDKVKPSFIVSDRIRIGDAAEAYQQFDKRGDVTKAVIKFGG